MEISSQKLKELVIYQQSRQISNLFKTFLNILEEIRTNRYNIDDNTYSSLRKKILDAGNSTSREMEELLSKFDFYLTDESISRINNSDNKPEVKTTNGS
jgi:hypothetical protein